MKRVVLLSLISVALISAVVGARVYLDQSRAVQSSSTAGPSFDPAMSLACERSCAAKMPYAASDLVTQPGVKIGDLTRCPVSGVVFQVTDDSPAVEHEGGAYHLCCSGCEGRFRSDPARFLGS